MFKKNQWKIPLRWGWGLMEKKKIKTFEIDLFLFLTFCWG